MEEQSTQINSGKNKAVRYPPPIFMARKLLNLVYDIELDQLYGIDRVD